ncbi:MAG TPA: alpha/beta hydrolase [Terracidiphilus sp.]|jgi:esterase/lipase superfamily enzyme|nr:alpha/beta hydrolase [Terracidiphilus sp.]
MHRFRPGVLSAVILLCLNPLARAQAAPRGATPVNVQGVVTGPDGNPVSGSRVDVRGGSSSDSTVADTRTDVEGRFALFGVALTPGPYLIHASATGFGEAEKTFKIGPARASGSLTFALALPPQPKERGANSGFTVVRILYATDRKAQTAASSLQYLGLRSDTGALSYGSCEVSIPETHALADVERPSIWKFEFRPDPEKHIVLQKVEAEEKTQFLKDVAGMVSASPTKEAFVFVHGYNVSFEDAAIRTAQLAYDFGFKGAPILYSWPSKGSLFGYLDDEQTVQQTAGSLKQFLQDVAASSGATVVHLIAHSMGNRALLPVLSQLAADPQFKDFDKFNTVVLAAPDVDRDLFMNLVAAIHKPQSKITLYVSEHDQALAASHLLFHKEPRAGEGGSDTIVMQGLDTVDVSKLSMDALGHSYFGDNRSVIEDLLKFLKGQLAPRPGLSKVPSGTLAYWQMLPGN